MVAAAVMVLTADQRRIPKDRSWANSKKMMANVTQWLKELLAGAPATLPIRPLLFHLICYHCLFDNSCDLV